MKAGIASYIEYTNLKVDMTSDYLKTMCADAIQYGFPAINLNQYFIPEAVELLAGSNVVIGCGSGYPLGSYSSKVKEYEAKDAVKMGAGAIDAMLNVSAFKMKRYDFVMDELHRIIQASRSVNDRVIMKLIIECCLLTDDEKKRICEMAVEAGMDYVKSSTGMNKGGATTRDIKLMYEAVQGKILVKAAGGIKDYAFAKELIEAGAVRLGSSSGPQIVAEERTANE